MVNEDSIYDIYDFLWDSFQNQIIVECILEEEIKKVYKFDGTYHETCKLQRELYELLNKYHEEMEWDIQIIEESFEYLVKFHDIKTYEHPEIMPCLMEMKKKSNQIYMQKSKEIHEICEYYF